MKSIRTFTFRSLVSIVLLSMLLMLPGPRSVSAQETSACQGMISPDCDPSGGNVEAQSGAYFARAYSSAFKGGYVAHGVGMRNTGYGTIDVRDVPAGSTVRAAYLFWAIMGPPTMTGYTYTKGYINGVAIAGTKVGTGVNPCWGGYSIYSYRASVTTRMVKGGNGTYNLSGFASGTVNGDDPFTYGSYYPMLEGATLVILYNNNNRPLTTVQVYNGATTTFSNQIHLNMLGLNAVGMKGFASTTFIGADGQNNASEPGSTFFTTALPSVGWEGSDPNGAGFNYSYGNLWDTATVDVRDMVEPPEPDFWATTQGSPDCLTWVAQVVSYSSGNQDTDGDRLKDGWELDGYGYDYNLPSFGADPLHKDLFIEADYMVHPTGGEDHLPSQAALDNAVAVFNNAPVSNPDGTTGIHLHIDTGGRVHGGGYVAAYNLYGGNDVGYQEHLGADTTGCASYDWSQFQAKKDANFYHDDAIFHYMIFAHDLAPCFGSVSGISRNGGTDALFIKGATDFIVSMGSWGSEGTDGQREGTFLHEFGHNLGLRHGGNDHTNYKPNYLSIMNYSFQTTGVYRSSAWGNYDYSRFLLPSLSETGLNEFNGLGALATGYGTVWYCGNSSQFDSTAESYIDWNCSQTYSTPVSTDINKNGTKTVLGSQNNWANITFQGGGVIGTGMAAAGYSAGVTRWVDELTYEAFQEFAAQLDIPTK